mmetsp:Transcript_6912/g.13031  ORF Transcript_6912/g.13031 Transcript_6912/m.13031 type:complete len:616 (+) Transcript_6912:258-2105(+)
MVRLQSRTSQSASKKLSIFTIVKYVLVSGLSFYFGSIITVKSFGSEDSILNTHQISEIKRNYEALLQVERKRNEELNARVQEHSKYDSSPQQAMNINSHNSQENRDNYDNHEEGRLPDAEIGQSLFDSSLQYMAVGISKIDREDFLGNFDYGSPSDGISPVLLMHHNQRSLPMSNEKKRQLSSSIVPMSAMDATENCDFLYVVTVPNKKDRMCTAIVQNYENFHMQKWMRRSEHGGPLIRTEPLRYVNRGMNSKGMRTFRVPDQSTIMKHWETLGTYFKNFHDVLVELKPIAEKVAVKNTIIVMTCNMGQSELLMNFVCNAKAKGLDVSNVLVFPTDQETKDLAEGLGLATFYDEKNFGDMPEAEAKHYGDKAFVAMMFAKVVCVQMINFLGYDLLFQDVDLVWYTNPLEYFHDPDNKFHGFDMYFQDDGAHSVRYSPYSANSGFYYIRSNAETKYFLVSLLYAGDMIITSKSHQQALIQVLAEHASQFGTRVKILSRDMNEFPGGWHYNSKAKKDFMKSIAKGDIVPYIFHMSWTSNKNNKLKYFKQMGEWYTEDKCIQNDRDSILGFHSGDQGTLLSNCCLPEANIVCFYRDKPSKIPCKDSDPIDAGRPSFW